MNLILGLLVLPLVPVIWIIMIIYDIWQNGL